MNGRAHDGSDITVDYIIRMPEALWKGLQNTGYADRHLTPHDMQVFKTAERTRTGSCGHYRCITGDHNTLKRIRNLLRHLAQDIRCQLEPLTPYGTRLTTIEKRGRQVIRLRSHVRVTPIPDDTTEEAAH